MHAINDVNFGYAIMLLPLVHYFVCYWSLCVCVHAHMCVCQIFNPAAQRYEVPVSLHDQDTPTPEEDADFKVSISKDPFSISITRKIDGQPLWV